MLSVVALTVGIGRENGTTWFFQVHCRVNVDEVLHSTPSSYRVDNEHQFFPNLRRSENNTHPRRRRGGEEDIVDGQSIE